MNDLPKVAIGRLWPKVSKAGRPYMVGVMGPAKLILLPDHGAPEGEPSYLLYVQERPNSSTGPAPKQRAQNMVTVAPPAPARPVGRSPAQRALVLAGTAAAAPLDDGLGDLAPDPRQRR
jgi:hypothetical protein